MILYRKMLVTMNMVIMMMPMLSSSKDIATLPSSSTSSPSDFLKPSLFPPSSPGYNGSMEAIEDDEQVYSYIPYEERPETYIVPLIFAFIFGIGSVGNGLTVLIIVREKLYKTPSYLFILNLSLGDLIVILGTVPFVATIYTFESWPYGEIVCRLSEFIRDTSISVTVLTLTVMSYDRYKATFAMKLRTGVHRQSHLRMLTIKYFNIVIVIWIISLIIGLPAALNTFVMDVDLGPNKWIKVCYPFPDSLGTWYPKLMVSVKFCLLYLFPLFVICFCYTLISLELRRYAKNPAIFRMSDTLHRRHRFRRRIVIFFVIAFVICFFPNHVFLLWFYFHPTSGKDFNKYWNLWRIFGFILSFLNSCINPIILYMTSQKFRQEFKGYASRCLRKPSEEPNEDSSSPVRTY